MHQGLQPQGHHRGGQGLAGHVFGRQAVQVRQALTGLGAVQVKTTVQGHVAAGVVRPAPAQGQHTALALHEPAQQGGQQLLRGGHEGGGGVQVVGPLQRHVELRCGLQPAVGFGQQAQGLVQRLQQAAAPAPGHPLAGQAAQLPPRAHAQSGQHRSMGASRIQRVQGQAQQRLGVCGLGGVLRQAFTGAQAGQGRQGRGAHRHMHRGCRV